VPVPAWRWCCRVRVRVRVCVCVCVRGQAWERVAMSLQRRNDVSFDKVWRRLRRCFSTILAQTGYETKGLDIAAYDHAMCSPLSPAPMRLCLCLI
jgi:hypothetical protein